MKRIAIIGGGISGLTAAYELEEGRRAGADIDWQLYEASDRLGGIIQTTQQDGFILEGGPDGWVTEKPWARDLCIELGLESELIFSNDATRKTYVLLDGKLVPMPEHMRLMVPEDLAALEGSPLFTDAARAAYAAEITRAEELRTSAPDSDESVASFVRRHFGEEVLAKLAAPLLSGVFGGDVEKLSVRSVMPQFVAMEREHGSLILALQAKRTQRGNKPQQPIFTSLRNGMQQLIDSLTETLPPDRIHLRTVAYEVDFDVEEWYIDFAAPQDRTLWHRLTHVIPYWDEIVIALPPDQVRSLFRDRSSGTVLAEHGLTILPDSHFASGQQPMTALLPTAASSAILVAFAWPAELASIFAIPPGFGFLVPQAAPPSGPWALDPGPLLLACTFVDQKFPHRVPAGGRILRAFFGGATADALAEQSDSAVAAAALTQLRHILGPIPDPARTHVRRLPHSLPQYEVGHLDRIARLETLVKEHAPGLHLLGNAYRGVGLPDLIRDARATARNICASI